MLHKKPVIVFLGTYPPRECGIATFTQDLLAGSQKTLEGRAVCKVCAMNLSSLDAYEYPKEVEWQIDQNNTADYASIARKISNDGLIAGVVLQHEYGIFGGEKGENLLKFIKMCKKPIVLTLHTVLPNPTPKMKRVTNQIVERASSIVVLTQSSKKILEEVYPASIGKVSVIPHGVHETPFADSTRYKRKLRYDGNTILTTFGLLSSSKGIEHVIRALPSVVKKHPNVRYFVLGATHPLVIRKEGELYRKKLIKLVEELKLKKHVKFYDRYFSLPNLLFFLKATDVYISTSINPDQAVSGTLSYALGSGRAVVSTSFPQAREIVNQENGRLVPIEDSKAFSSAILELLEDKERLKNMHKTAYNQTRHMLWHNVAKQYMELLSVHSPLIRTVEPVLPPLKLTHLRKMTDEFGLFQFATHATPNKKSGYTLDDNARALIICSELAKEGTTRSVSKLLNIYLSFIKSCQTESGTFINYISYFDNSPTGQNAEEDVEEANARAIFALSTVIANPHLSKKIHTQAIEMFLKALPNCKNYSHQRAKAFIIKAFCVVTKKFKRKFGLDKTIIKYANDLVRSLEENIHNNWIWFDNYLSYNNAILPESLFTAGHTLKNKHFLDAGKKSLEFLIKETFKDDFYFPIGQTDWYRQGQTRSSFDQQPEDPASMILALNTAYQITKNEEYKHLAHKCFTWFMGNNILGISLYNYKTGGCYDGLHPDRVNLNQGAESLVSYLSARIVILKLV